MDRKITKRENEFLVELRELMAKYNVMLSVEDDKICIDVDYDKDDKDIILPYGLTVFFDIDDLILKNS